jgi:hypothetical protein
MESNYERLERELHEYFSRIEERKRLRHIQERERRRLVRQREQTMLKLRELCRSDAEQLPDIK